MFYLLGGVMKKYRHTLSLLVVLLMMLAVMEIQLIRPPGTGSSWHSENQYPLDLSYLDKWEE